MDLWNLETEGSTKIKSLADRASQARPTSQGLITPKQRHQPVTGAFKTETCGEHFSNHYGREMPHTKCAPNAGLTLVLNGVTTGVEVEKQRPRQ